MMASGEMENAGEQIPCGNEDTNSWWKPDLLVRVQSSQFAGMVQTDLHPSTSFSDHAGTLFKTKTHPVEGVGLFASGEHD